MTGKAIARYVRISPFKVRLVADLVRGKRVREALNILHFSPKRASLPVEKAIRSAVANAVESSEGVPAVEAEDMIVREIYVDEGPTLKRIRPRAMGRADRVRKRTSHITIVVSSEED